MGLILIVVTLLAYQPAWNGQPLLDDKKRLTTQENRSLDGLARFWTEPYATKQYHPLVDTLLWIEDKFWGERMLGYHLVNILLHGASALLLLKILRQLEVPGAWLATAIFALHPVHVESVAWMAELKNTLSGIFFFGSVLAYLRFEQNRNSWSYALVLFLFSLGLMAKAVVAALPAAILIVLWWKRGRLKWTRDVKPLIPFCILGIGAGLVTAWMERNFAGAEGEQFAFSMIDRFLIAGRGFWFYLSKLFWPSNLVLIYPRWNVSAMIWWQYLFPIAALCFFAVAWALRQRWRWLWAGLLFFVVMLLPMLGFFNVSFFRFSFVADHFQYLASIGIITPVSAGGAFLLTRLRGWHRTMGYGFCLALLATLTGLTWRQSRMYRDAETCYRMVIEKNPNSWQAHMNVGHALSQRGLAGEAIAHFQKVLEINPNYAPATKRAHFNLGNALLKMGLVDEAIAHFEKALEIEPNYAEAHMNLGSVLHRRGRLKEAAAHYQRAVERGPQLALARNNLAWMLATCSDASLRNGSKAVELALQADQLSGGRDPIILRTLAAAYAEAGQFSQAVETAQRARQLATDQGKNALANALRNQIGLYQAASPYHETPE
ncbi:MAG TPA: tetratricopeptide repeat protein [Chthoniobacterales bacterium]|nr:tetratricopeptide repeat protein [Chthoniobacterales bacterium]